MTDRRDMECEAVARDMQGVFAHHGYDLPLALIVVALDAMRAPGDGRQAGECTCPPTSGTDYEPHEPGCPKSNRSPQGEDHKADPIKTVGESWADDQLAYSKAMQGEAHETGISEAALDAAEQAVHACRRYALGHPSRKAIYVEARDEAYDVLKAALPHLSRVSAPERDTVKLVEAARKMILAADTYPPEIESATSTAWRLGGAARDAWNVAMVELREALAEGEWS